MEIVISSNRQAAYILRGASYDSLELIDVPPLCQVQKCGDYLFARGYDTANSEWLLYRSPDGFRTYDEIKVGFLDSYSWSLSLICGDNKIVVLGVDRVSQGDERTRNIVWVSTDFGETFTRYVINSDSNQYTYASNSIKGNYLNGKFVIGLLYYYNGYPCFYSVDGSTWSYSNVGNAEEICQIAYLDGTYLATNLYDSYYKSDNLVSWTPFEYVNNQGPICVTTDKFIRVEWDSGLKICTSSNASTWSSVPCTLEWNWIADIFYDEINQKIVAVHGSGLVATSDNNLIFTQEQSVEYPGVDFGYGAWLAFSNYAPQQFYWQDYTRSAEKTQ